MQVGGVGGLATLAKKGLEEHTLMFDSHKPRRSELNKKVEKCKLVGWVGSLRSLRKVLMNSH